MIIISDQKKDNSKNESNQSKESFRKIDRPLTDVVTKSASVEDVDDE